MTGKGVKAFRYTNEHTMYKSTPEYSDVVLKIFVGSKESSSLFQTTEAPGFARNVHSTDSASVFNTVVSRGF
jgi:hypothetical protein